MPPRIQILEGDITLQATDAIVNAANTAMRPGGGVDGAITRAAGHQALADRERLIRERGTPPLETGGAGAAARGGALPARWIIYTAGPVYSGTETDGVLLRSCHVASLLAAEEAGARSVAFPAISCGIYGYPATEAAPIALAAVMEAHTQVGDVRFVLFGSEMGSVFRAAMRAEAERRGWTEDELDRWLPPPV
jgi:O-acetyl-ADP-ribose deacetylase (regulator of RNase III)